ncbi:alkaline phosphatase D family protein [Temperatibacter marinus]|uniref:Alkaline phosphatase D family protein n=1 Tax=Temperatibacter marinus TaxID=1456591 RepID=A0AA52EFQ4_9PROT|nr:alkaline phosphatase D family protein [Temperatibacter marinus]WND01484.1 alkaline phosphatase D family protein [Temperatibacter marinus]
MTRSMIPAIFLFSLSLTMITFPAYQVNAESENQMGGPSFPFKTPKMAPWPKKSQNLSRIAFGSCNDEESPMPIWQSIYEAKPDLFLFTGDNVYVDINNDKWITDPKPSDFDFAYGKLAENKLFSKVAAQVPMMATFDDHDFGKDDAGSEYPLKKLAKDKMLDFFNVSQTHKVREREGVYYSKTFGEDGKKVQVIMLDTRYFRSPLTHAKNPGPGKERYVPSQDPDQTMLGDQQWAWFERQLEKPADVRIIVSTIQVIANSHGWESWRTMPLERKKLYETLNTIKTGRTFLITGDRHVAGLYQKTSGMKKPLIEVTASSLNKSYNSFTSIQEEWDKEHQIGTLYGPVNFGLLSIDWDAMTVSVDIKDVQGKTVRSMTVNAD